MSLHELEAYLGGPLPSPVAALYDAPDPIGPVHDLMRLLSPAEAIETNRALREFDSERDPDFYFFWTDDNSNFAGVYLSGELAPRVALYDHEEPSDTPAYFGVESFQAARALGAESGLAWYELTADYPVVGAAASPHAEADRALAHKYLQAYREDPANRQRLAFLAMNLLPPDETESICELMSSEDMWVQERACQVVGLRKHQPAITRLKQVAIGGLHTGRVAAILALKKMETPEARGVLEELRDQLDWDYSLYLEP